MSQNWETFQQKKQNKTDDMVFQYNSLMLTHLPSAKPVVLGCGFSTGTEPKHRSENRRQLEPPNPHL